jgi:mRNA interferase RelE/StbE
VASYKVQIKPSAVKELEKVPSPDRQRIVIRIQNLAMDPRPPGVEKLTGQNRYRVRQGNYRIVYEIVDAELVVLVVRVGNRREVYR